MRTQVQTLALLSGLRIWHCCELWRRLTATALIQPLAWEPLYAMGVALKRQKKIFFFSPQYREVFTYQFCEHLLYSLDHNEYSTQNFDLFFMCFPPLN